MWQYCYNFVWEYLFGSVSCTSVQLCDSFVHDASYDLWGMYTNLCDNVCVTPCHISWATMSNRHHSMWYVCVWLAIWLMGCLAPMFGICLNTKLMFCFLCEHHIHLFDFVSVYMAGHTHLFNYVMRVCMVYGGPHWSHLLCIFIILTCPNMWGSWQDIVVWVGTI